MEYESSSSGADSNQAGPSSAPPKKVKKKYVQHFKESWKFNRQWLVESRLGTQHFFCKLCKKNYTAGLSEIVKHEKTEAHKKRVRAIQNQPTIFQATERKITEKKMVQESEIRISAFIAEHNLPFRASDHLPELITKICPDSKIAAQLNCGRTKCTNIIKNVTGEVEKDHLLVKMRKSKFSLIIDESTDRGCTKHLCLVARIIIDDSVKDCFLTLIPIKDGTALALYNKIVTFFNNNNIDYKNNLVGFAADGANVMMGQHNSVKALLLRDIPNLFILKCVCHSFALCASYAATKIPRDVEDLTREIYKYFQYSYKKTGEYQKFQQFANVKVHKILHPCQTRWLSVQQVVSRILEQWNALKLFFIDAAVNDNLRSTEIILEKLNNASIQIYLEFLNFVLPYFTDLNKEMQSEKPKIYVLYTRIVTITKTLLDMFMKQNCINNILIENIEYNDPRNYVQLEEIYLGPNVTELLTNPVLSNADIHSIRVNCLSFLIKAVKQIYNRFDFKSPEFKILQYVTPEYVKKKSYPSIIPVVKCFPLSGITQNMHNNIDREWRSLRNVDLSLFSDDFVVFWNTVQQLKTGDGAQAYPLLSKLMLFILVLPHSSANVERVFSTMNLLKTKTRNRIKTNSLVGLLHTKRLFENATCYNFTICSEMLNNMKTNVLYKKQTEFTDSESE
jgi:hypothetical protein